MPSYYSPQDPARYHMAQQDRRDQQIRDMINLFLQTKGFKERQRQFDVEQSASEKELDWRKNYQQALMDYYQFQADPEAQFNISQAKTLGKAVATPQKPEMQLPANVVQWAKENLGHTDETLKTLDDASKRQLVARYHIEKTKTPKAPTASEQKKADLSAMVKRGEITKEQADEAFYGLKPKETPEETLRAGRTARDAAKRRVDDVTDSVYAGDKVESLRKIIKDIPGTPPVVSRLRVDMPHEYNVAKELIQSGFASKDDKDIIRKYDDEFDFFKTITTGINVRTGEVIDKPPVKSWKDYLIAYADKKVDKAQMKLWFDIYMK